MNAEERRGELGAFLRSRRDLLQPEALGLDAGVRRRARGLKREEVAVASSVSTAWYTWLEQGRKIRASSQALRRIAKTLRLSEPEWMYLSLLGGLDTGVAITSTLSAGSPPIASIQKTLDAFTNTPAILYNERFDVLRANAAALSVYGRDVVTSAKWECNMIWRFFVDPDRRRMYPDALLDLGIRNLIGVLRLNWVSDRDNGAGELVDELRHVSVDFDSIWIGRSVAQLASVAGRVRPRGYGQPINIEYTRFYVPDARGHAIAALVPTDPASAKVLERHLNHAG